MQVHDKVYIDGAWVPSEGTGTIDVFDSSNGEVIGTIPNGAAIDVAKAAKAARAAFDDWAAKAPEERAKFCKQIAEGLGARMDEIATIVTREAGMPKWLSLIVQAGLPINSFNTAADMARATSTRRRWAPPSWCASRSASWAASRRGTSPSP
jgi:aldehyde dehydrogenase (NAD+)